MQLDHASETSFQGKEVEKPEKEAEKELSSQEKEMCSQEKPVVEVEEPVKEVKKTARDEEKEVPRRKPTISEDDDLDVACPVCGEVFSAHTTLRQRTAHVEACLRRANPPDAPPAKPKKAEEEDGLWEEEEITPHAPAGERVDVGGVHGRRVIHDDGDDAYYRSLLSSYLEWRAAADSPAGEALCEQYHQTADSIYEWRACGQTPKAAAVQEALDRFYREEPAVLLPSGYAMPRHLWEVLYPYQRRGVEWVLGLHAQGVGGIVADEMGLGKTLQIVAALVALKFTQEAIRRGRNLSCLPKGEVEGADGGKDGGKSENESGGKSDIENGGKSDIESGGKSDIESGGKSDIESGGKSDIESGGKDGGKNTATNPNTLQSQETITHAHATDTPVDLNTRHLPSLLIVPATLLGHWLRELRHWCPLLRSVVMHSTSQTVADGASLRSVLLQCRAKHRYDVIITTYEGIRLSTLYTKQEWFYAILDEGGKIKNAKVGVSRACKQLRTVHRLLISGTPLQNNLKELWSLVDFVFPGRLGTIEAFVSSFVVPISRGIYSNATRQASSLGYQCSLMLQDSVSPFILRRLKKDVKKELPPKTEQVLSCLLSPLQEKKYLEYLQSEQVQSSLLGRVMPFKAIIRLRQICNHPVFYQSLARMGAAREREPQPTRLRHVEGMFYKPEYEKKARKEEEEEEEAIDYDAVDWREWAHALEVTCRSSKMLVMNEVLHLWKKEGHKVLVYTQTVSMLNIIERYAKEQGFSFCRMDGSTPIVKRQALVDLFNGRADIFLFLLTTRVGGLGINLVGADRVILFDPDWNPSVDIQARERCWRIGQRRPVTVYRLITSGTIEEKIYHRQIFKTVLSNRVLGEGNDLCSFTSTNLNDLFSYGGRGAWV